MKKLRKTFILKTLFIFLFILLLGSKVFANNDIANSLHSVEYSDDFKEWLELSEEEKKNSMQPRMYNITNIDINSKNPFFRALRAYTDPRYDLRNIISPNLTIRDQMQTNSCWAFASLSSLETNLAMADYKKGTTARVYDYSERHMEYATSKYFANSATNSRGYNRTVGDGGQWYTALSYLINGQGAIVEDEMPFENNETLINLSEIQNKTVASQVQDTIDFPNYLSDENASKATEIKNQIKQHIHNYGSVFASIHGNSASTTAFACYNNATGAKYCNTTSNHGADHAIAIVGWDDNFAIDNFASGTRPANKGAWIVRNSWGTSIGDAGFMYVSYEDVNIARTLFGIVKASDRVDYENIYQYDEYYPGYTLGYDRSKIFLGNVFDKKTSGKEYITQVSIYAPEVATYKVYVNPNGTGKTKADLKAVTLKAGETETISPGYHTLEFATPVEIKASSFFVAVEVQTGNMTTYFQLETKIPGIETFDDVKIETGKCFFTIENGMTGELNTWNDLGKLTENNGSVINGDSTIKAFTVSELDNTSLKNIEVTKAPNKTTYYEGENFNPDGMVVKANYNNKLSRILDGSSYNITNGTSLNAGQTTVTISYEGKSVEQTIHVISDTLTDLTIKTPPTKVAYTEGQNFDKTGMVVEATYQSGNKRTITDFTIENGYNLKPSQTSVTISYGGKTVTQRVTVASNTLQGISITTPPNKTQYYAGQDFDKTGMVVTGTFKDGSTLEILDYNVENGTDLTQSKTSITINYEGKKAYQSITVVEDSLSHLTIVTQPNKKQYIVGQNFDKVGMKIQAVYQSGKTQTLLNYTITNGTNLQVGQTSVTISYGGKTVEQPITVIANSLASISISKAPSKTQYIAGQNFDETGMVVVGTLQDGTTSVITDYTIANGNNLTVGQTSVTIAYNGKTTTQSITVIPNSVASIRVTKAPTKTQYIVGQTFDKTGMVVTGTLQDGSSVEITAYTVTNGSNLSSGQTSVTISFEGKTTTQPITVIAKTVTGITIISKPTKQEYIQNKAGEELSLEGGSIKATYNDGSEETVNMTSPNIVATGFSNKTLGKVTITLSYQSKTATFDITIIEAPNIKDPDDNKEPDDNKDPDDSKDPDDDKKPGDDKNPDDEKVTAKNSDFNHATTNVKKVQAYYYTKNPENSYILVQMEINQINRITTNDKVEYYYYLSPYENEQNIENWTKISEVQTANSQLQFEIDSRKMSNFAEISNENSLYLYIKEVAIKGGDQRVFFTQPLKVESNIEAEIFVDGVKIQTSTKPGNDSTTAPGKIPQTGIKITLMISIVAVLGLGIVLYVRYKKLSNKMK